MATILTDLRDKYRYGNVVTRLIFINTGVFVAVSLLSVLLMLFNGSAAPLVRWFQLPASIGGVLMQPWSLLTYMYLHTGLLHILFNMLWLYWFGELFLQFFSTVHLRGLYLLGGLCGGLLYILAYNVFPFFAGAVEGSYLLGASASVLAIVAAAAYREPDYPIGLMFFGTVRLKYLALAVIGLDVLMMTSSNAGGHIAHLGGALAGLWFAASLGKGRDVTLWINKTINAFRSSGSAFKRQPKMKVKQGGKYKEAYARKDEPQKVPNAEITRILNKLKQSGYDSLTTEEKRKLFDGSNRN